MKSKKIRAVSSHFEEDPLRVYRVARFASQFDFKVEESDIIVYKDNIFIKDDIEKEKRIISIREKMNRLRKEG